MPEPEGFNIRGKEEIDLPWAGKLVFYNCIVGGVIDLRYLPSIRKGIMEVMETGPLTGSYIRDVRVMVYDGEMDLGELLLHFFLRLQGRTPSGMLF